MLSGTKVAADYTPPDFDGVGKHLFIPADAPLKCSVLMLRYEDMKLWNR